MMVSSQKLPFGAALKRYRNQYLLVAPFAIVFFLFTVLPVAAAIGLSFTSFNMTSMPSFVGLTNYITLIVEDDVFLTALKNTLVFALLTGPLSYIMCLPICTPMPGTRYIERKCSIQCASPRGRSLRTPTHFRSCSRKSGS